MSGNPEEVAGVLADGVGFIEEVDGFKHTPVSLRLALECQPGKASVIIQDQPEIVAEFACHMLKIPIKERFHLFSLVIQQSLWPLYDELLKHPYLSREYYGLSIPDEFEVAFGSRVYIFELVEDSLFALLARDEQERAYDFLCQSKLYLAYGFGGPVRIEKGQILKRVDAAVMTAYLHILTSASPKILSIVNERHPALFPFICGKEVGASIGAADKLIQATEMQVYQYFSLILGSKKNALIKRFLSESRMMLTLLGESNPKVAFHLKPDHFLEIFYGLAECNDVGINEVLMRLDSFKHILKNINDNFLDVKFAGLNRTILFLSSMLVGYQNDKMLSLLINHCRNFILHMLLQKPFPVSDKGVLKPELKVSLAFCRKFLWRLIKHGFDKMVIEVLSQNKLVLNALVAAKDAVSVFEITYRGMVFKEVFDKPAFEHLIKLMWMTDGQLRSSYCAQQELSVKGVQQLMPIAASIYIFTKSIQLNYQSVYLWMWQNHKQLKHLLLEGDLQKESAVLSKKVLIAIFIGLINTDSEATKKIAKCLLTHRMPLVLILNIASVSVDYLYRSLNKASVIAFLEKQVYKLDSYSDINTVEHIKTCYVRYLEPELTEQNLISLSKLNAKIVRLRYKGKLAEKLKKVKLICDGSVMPDRLYSVQPRFYRDAVRAAKADNSALPDDPMVAPKVPAPGGTLKPASVRLTRGMKSIIFSPSVDTVKSSENAPSKKRMNVQRAGEVDLMLEMAQAEPANKKRRPIEGGATI